MSYPMFGIGLQYMLIDKSATAQMEQGMEPEMTGMDMIMPMFSISLPLYRNKYKAQQRESRFMWQSAREKYNNTLNLLQSDLFRLKHQLDDAERKIALLSLKPRNRNNWLGTLLISLVVQEFVSAKSDLSDQRDSVCSGNCSITNCENKAMPNTTPRWFHPRNAFLNSSNN